jgi:hypothetical protein
MARLGWTWNFWKSGSQKGFYIDDEHERDETLIRAAKLQLAAAATLALWLQTRVGTDAGAAHPNCRWRMTTRILEEGGLLSRHAFAAGS